MAIEYSILTQNQINCSFVQTFLYLRKVFMELPGFILRGIGLARSEPIISIIILGVIAVLFYFKRKAMLQLLATILIIAILSYFIYLIYGMTSSGFFQKQDLIEKSQP